MARPYFQTSMVGQRLQDFIFGGRTHCYFGPKGFVLRTHSGALVVRPTWLIGQAESEPHTGLPRFQEGTVVGTISFVFHDTRRGLYAPTHRNVHASIFGLQHIGGAAAEDQVRIHSEFARCVFALERFRRLDPRLQYEVAQTGSFSCTERLWAGYVHNAMAAVCFVVMCRSGLLGLLAAVRRRRRPGYCCVACGYDLRGTTGARCSECGTPSPRD